MVPPKKTVANIFVIKFLMNIFKAKRIEMELSITDVVNDIKYPTSAIKSIEKDDYSFLPQPYLYYFLKQYGTYLRIKNLDDILKKYKYIA